MRHASQNRLNSSRSPVLCMTWSRPNTPVAPLRRYRKRITTCCTRSTSPAPAERCRALHRHQGPSESLHRRTPVRSTSPSTSPSGELSRVPPLPLDLDLRGQVSSLTASVRINLGHAISIKSYGARSRSERSGIAQSGSAACRLLF
jgi:hypothetical protein